MGRNRIREENIIISPNSLLKLILDSKALSIWNRKTGPVFWYAANVPGPFYLNTELMIGRELAAGLLGNITAIVAATPDPKARAAQLQAAIMDAYREQGDYRMVIRALVDAAKTEFPAGTFDVMSGGERRDWLFSIPLAAEIGAPHVYLFKNRSIFCGQELKPGQKALHVSDLINNAASYFDLWLPLLQKSGLVFSGTLTVNTRGDAGLRRMQEAGHKVAALNRVDLAFFRTSCAGGLIERETLDEIAVYFGSAREWAARYLMHDAALFDTAHIDRKSFERMAAFFSNDPWDLREQHAAFFARMQAAIAARQAA